MATTDGQVPLHSSESSTDNVKEGSNDSPSKRVKPTRSKKNQQYKKKLDVGSGPHILQTNWTFWYCKKQSKQSNFETTLVSLGTCSTVEEFWGYYSRLRRPHELTSNTNLHLFRGTTRPMWESFPTGGNWVLRMKKGCSLLARMWEELLIACIGETFEEPDVLGVVLSIRPKEDALYLWNANHHLKYVIGEKLKAIMHLPPNCPMEYRTNRFNMESRFYFNEKKESEITEQHHNNDNNNDKSEVKGDHGNDADNKQSDNH